MTYDDGSIKEFAIKGKLMSSSISDMEQAVDMQIGDGVTSIDGNAFRGCSELIFFFAGRTQEDIDDMSNRYWGIDRSRCVPEIA